MVRSVLSFLPVLSLAAALPAATESPLFVERARGLGVDFVHVNGATGRYFMPEIMGPGAALFDSDGDGDLDLFLVQGGGKPHRLYRNDLDDRPGGKGLRFTDVTAASGITAAGGTGMGVAAGDYDGDGRTDLYVTALGSNQLWRNRGDGTFEDVTARAGADDPRWSVSAAFLDYDRDGRLDLYVGNYLDAAQLARRRCRTSAGAPDYCGPVPSEAVPDRLLRNRGDGTFEDVTQRSGVGSETGPALGVSTADFDGDGWIDVYVANDETPNLLWINRRDGTFRNDALIAGAAVSGQGRPQASMGVDAGDYDRDGDEDLVMDNLNGEGNTLYRNLGGGLFEDATQAAGLLLPSLRFTGFGAAWLDYDNDSWLDLLVVNGAVKVLEEQVRTGDPLPLKQRKHLFRNLGNGRFEEVTAAAGPAFAILEVSRGAAFGDLDDDGDTDVVVANNSGLARLLLNQVGSRRSWLGLRLLTGTPGRDALGARVALHRPGAPPLWRRARADGSYASANDPRVLFGLGDGNIKVEKVVVHWPSGRVEEWRDLPAGTYTTLKEGTGTAVR